MPRHEQTPLLTVDNRMVFVDHGLYPTLRRLQQHGVKTQFSCQGDDNETSAYVVADTWTFAKLLWKIRRSYIRGELSWSSRTLVEQFRSGHRDVDVLWFRGRRARKLLHVGNKRWDRLGFSWEYQLDNHYGLRTTFRWPVEYTYRINHILEEMS